MAEVAVSRQAVRRFRFRRHDLDGEPGATQATDQVGILDMGVQDTGPDGAGWALAIRGAPPGVLDDLAFAWSLRGAPHAYRRGDLRDMAVATAPLSEADARKRIFDAAKPLTAAGIPALEALRTIAEHLRSIVARPTVKGEVSSHLTELLTEPYLRSCRSCDAVHAYENPFRLAALQGGIELEPGTSPPVMRRVPRLRPPMYRKLGNEAPSRFHVIRNYLRFYGPARARDVAEFLDAPVREVRDHWPDDVAAVEVADAPSSTRQPRFVLIEDVDTLAEARGTPAPALRLVGPYDPFLQLRDRDVLVADEARRKTLWPVLGRPGAIVADGEVLGTWRPRASGKRLKVVLEPWKRLSKQTRSGVGVEAERLAAHRGVTLASVSEE